MPTPRRGARGFTLLELLVAVALLALLSVLSWRGMDSVLRTRDRLTQASDELRALSAGFAQLEQDLRATRLVDMMVPDEAPVAFGASAESSRPELVLLRRTAAGSDPASQAVPLQRVRYRWRERRLERGFSRWSASDGAPPQRDPGSGMIWQPLLAGVDAADFRAWQAARGWVTAGARADAGPPRGAGNAARARIDGIELTLVRGDRRIVRVFAVRD